MCIFQLGKGQVFIHSLEIRLSLLAVQMRAPSFHCVNVNYCDKSMQYLMRKQMIIELDYCYDS